MDGMKISENRIETLRKYIDNILLNMTDTEERRCAYLHLYGVAQSCALIALKRGENVELATMAGMLHDVYSYANMDSQDHARKGATLAANILEELNLTTVEETKIICNAIYVHSNKESVHSEFSELLKDADVLQHCLYNPLFEVNNTRKVRYERLKLEFNLV